MDKRKVTVLITSAGSAAAMNCIDALHKQNDFSTIHLVGVDADSFSPGLYLTDVGYVVPRADQESYIDAILEICRKEGVDVILPTFSTEISVFAAHESVFSKESIYLLVSPIEVVRTLEDKWLAHQFFLSHSVLTPATWLADELPAYVRYPLYLKPTRGSGSRNSRRIDSNEELMFYKKRIGKQCIIQVFVEGPEYTIDVAADRFSRVVAAIPRERLKVKGGMAITSRTIKADNLIEEAERIISLAHVIGPANIQGFLTREGFTITDVNTRFSAGGLPLAIAAGANIPLIVVKLALGLPVPRTEHYEQELLMLRYYTEIFVPKGGIINSNSANQPM